MPRVTITIPERTPQPYRFDLLREIVTIGRGLDNDIVVGCGSVSGKHSEMRRVKGGYEIVDVGSTNGIKVDGIRRETVVLHTGMTVKLGDVEFGFTLSEDELAELATESEAITKAAAQEKEDAKEIEVSEKPSSKEKEKEKEKEPKSDKKAKDDDGPDKLPPVRLDKKKEKQEQEAEEKRKEERKERERKEKEARAEREEKSGKRERSERSDKDKDRDEFAESKAVTIGSGFILFTLIAAAAAFFYGAQTRHEKDTGENLLKSIVNKEDAKNDAPTEVEDKPEGGAE